jgi:hypothetical protein
MQLKAKHLRIKGDLPIQIGNRQMDMPQASHRGHVEHVFT